MVAPPNLVETTRLEKIDESHCSRFVRFVAGSGFVGLSRCCTHSHHVIETFVLSTILPDFRHDLTLGPESAKSVVVWKLFVAASSETQFGPNRKMPQLSCNGNKLRNKPLVVISLGLLIRGEACFANSFTPSSPMYAAPV